jgi:hypothetical protein
MTDPLPDSLADQLVALYRAAAVDEPPARLDKPILRAARRRQSWDRMQVAAAAGLFLVMTAVAAATMLSSHDAAPEHIASVVPPGLADGQERVFLLQAQAMPEEQTSAVTIYPAMMTDWPPSYEGVVP